MSTTRGPRTPDRDHHERLDTAYDKRRRPPDDASFLTYAEDGKVVIRGRHAGLRFRPRLTGAHLSDERLRRVLAVFSKRGMASDPSTSP